MIDLAPRDALGKVRRLILGGAMVLVVLEGLEGVGKTTLGRLVSERLPAVYLKTPPPAMDGARAFVAERNDPAFSFYFYLSSLHAIQDEIAAAVADGGVAIVDRYLGSTIAYHDHGRSFDAPAHDAARLCRPDLSLHVRCQPQDRAGRLAARGFNIFDRRASDDEAIEAYFGRTCDQEFWNDGPVEPSADRLTDLLRARLGQHV